MIFFQLTINPTPFPCTYQSYSSLTPHSNMSTPTSNPLMALEKTLTYKFDYYPPCTITITSGDPTPLTNSDLELLRKSWFKCIQPLLKHIEKPEDISTLLTAFSTAPSALVQSQLDQAAWDFIGDIAYHFPTLLFTQVEKTIIVTQGENEYRKKWVRKRLLKDLRKSERRIRGMHQGAVVEGIYGALEGGAGSVVGGVGACFGVCAAGGWWDVGWVFG